MATFVLVHGAWHGSWCWKRVRKALQAQGHDVFTPTLTGVGERSHLLSRDVNLDTHIADVENLLRWEDLSGVVLCGHSYGGCVIGGVADRLPERIQALVYLDAFVLQDGQSLHDTLPPSQKDLQLDLARDHGEGWRVPPIPAEVFNVNASDRDWVNRQCTMQSLATFQQPIKLTGMTVRPLFLLPFCYFAYKKSVWGMALTVAAVTSSMFWFPVPATPDPRVVALLAVEREYVSGPWTLGRIVLTALVPIWFVALAWTVRRRSWLGVATVIGSGTLLKVGWLFRIAGSSAWAIVSPVALGTAVCAGLLLIAYMRVRRSAA